MPNETPWTKAPWAIDPDPRPEMEWNNHIVCQSDPNIRICFMAHDGNPANSQGKANARLIAAAPEMAELLNYFVKTVPEHVPNERCDQTRALLAKIKDQTNE